MFAEEMVLIEQNIYFIFISTKNLHNMIDYYIVFVKKGDFLLWKKLEVTIKK